MAETYKILSKTAPANTAEHVFYSTSAGTEAILTNITVVNRSTTDKTFDINVLDSVVTENDLEPSTITENVIVTTTAPASDEMYISNNNGSTWTPTSLPFTPDPYVYWKPVQYIDGKYAVTVSTGMSNTTSYYTSTDAITWTQNSYPAPFTVNDFIKLNGKLYVLPGANVNDWTYSPNFYSSTDAITWTIHTVTSMNNQAPNRLFYGNGVYLGTGADSGMVHYSSDGVTYSSVSLSSGFVNSGVGANYIAYNSSVNLFLAVGVDFSNNSGLAATSTDGFTWTDITMPLVNSIPYYVYSNNNYFIMTGSDGLELATSTDAVTWSLSTQPISYGNYYVKGDTFYNFKYDSASYYTSTDAVSWVSHTEPTNIHNFNDFTRVVTTQYETSPIHSLYKNVTIPANTSKVLEPGVVLGSENSILIKGSSDLTFSAYGVELS